jgi:hypothetical protein
MPERLESVVLRVPPDAPRLGRSRRAVSDAARLPHDYTVGRTHTARGEPCELRARYPVVLAVPSPEIERFMGTSDRRKLLEHLRGLRDRDVLVCPREGRLTAKIRGWECRAYVFACAERDLPRVRRTRVRLA